MTFADDSGTPRNDDPTGLLDTPENRRNRTLRRSALLAVPLLVAVAITGLVAADADTLGQKSPQAAGTAPTTAQIAAKPIPRPLPEKPLYRISTQDKVAFLTIDDGAYKDPEMIRVLREAGIRPTLFLTDQYARQDAEFFRRMRDETGGAIENHTLDHPNLQGKSYDIQKNQICGTSDAYERAFGKRPTLLRPPYGNHDENTMRAAGDCGIERVVHWSAEIRNGEMQFAVGDRLRPGDIVLMHFRKEFKADIRSFVDRTRAAGLTPALLEDYLK
ncbi:polysaccharide deacetylase family protein [Embleya sp. NPDC059259]|uniref:polysaccharide deacetylase family protein n=1 Tax=unclassified Embleya TaxID=2699296 RepID=UPI003676C7F2